MHVRIGSCAALMRAAVGRQGAKGAQRTQAGLGLSQPAAAKDMLLAAHLLAAGRYTCRSGSNTCTRLVGFGCFASSVAACKPAIGVNGLATTHQHIAVQAVHTWSGIPLLLLPVLPFDHLRPCQAAARLGLGVLLLLETEQCYAFRRGSSQSQCCRP